MYYDLVLHVDQADSSIPTALRNAVNYAKALPDEKYTMVLVVNSKAVTAFEKNNVNLEPALQEAAAAGLQFRLCQNALAMHNLTATDLFPQCKVIPAGIVELVDLQRKGYVYIKP